MLKFIQNEEIKSLLEKKISIINEGKELNLNIELKAEPIVSKFLSAKGIIEDGESEDGFGDGSYKYKSFKGSYNKLQQAFRDSASQILQETIAKDLEDELNELKSKELQVNKINEQINEILTKDVVPTLGLSDTEQLIQVELRGMDIELTTQDVIEEYKNRYLEARKIHNDRSIASLEATQA